MKYTSNVEIINAISNYGDYIKYVDKLRNKFSIRIQVRHEHPDRKKFEDLLESYLLERLDPADWCMQASSVNSFYFVWFSNKEDALAFRLTWNGTVV